MRKLVLLLAFVDVLALALPAQAQSTTAHHSQLNCTASSTPNATYTFYRSTTSGGPYLPVASKISTCSYDDKNLAANTKYCYVATATANGMTESVYSNEACGTTKPDPTAAPTGLTVTVE